MRPGDNEGSGAPDTPPFEGTIGPKRPGTRSPLHTGPRRIRSTAAKNTDLGRRLTASPWRGRTTALRYYARAYANGHLGA